jgi:hypothetical protein
MPSETWAMTKVINSFPSSYVIRVGKRHTNKIIFNKDIKKPRIAS